MNLRSAFRILGLTSAVFPFLFAGSARAQADFTARRPASVVVFGGYSNTQPDYGAAHNNGATFGAEYNRSFGWKVVPGLEARANLTSGPNVTEHLYAFGPRLQMSVYHRFHPYADIEVGVGGITYPEYSRGIVVHDTGFVYSGGGGVDIDLIKGFALRGDYQLQNWNLGQNIVEKPDGENFTLSPGTLTVGFSYRIPFRSWTGQRHRGY